MIYTKKIFTSWCFFFLCFGFAHAQWDQINPALEGIALTRSGAITVGEGGVGTKLTVDGNGNAVIIKRDAPIWDQYVARMGISVNTGTRGLRFQMSQNGGSSFVDALHLGGDGDVGIGTTNTLGHRLAVKGKIGCEELIVRPVGYFPDYVFAPSYDLMSLEQVASHIAQEGRLPNMPKGKDIDASQQMPVGEITLLQQEKIEEIFLHLIELNQELVQLKKENEMLKHALNGLSSQE